MDIVMCDDHRLLAELLSSVLAERGHEVQVLLSPADVCAVAATRPVDVCVMDLGFPVPAQPDPPALSPLEAICRLVALGVRVVVLTGSEQSATVDEARAAGASSYLVKGEPIGRLLDAVEGSDPVWPLGNKRSGPAARPAGHRAWTRGSLADFLTPSEWSVLEGLVFGESTTALAARLGVRPATARTHVQNLLGKLCVHSRLEAVALAIEHDLVSVPADELG